MPTAVRGRALHRAGPLLILAASLLWGTIGTARSLLPPTVDAHSVAAARVTIGGLAFLAVTRPAQLHGFAWRRAPGGWTVLAAAAMSLYQVTFFAALPMAGVAIGTVLALGAVPVFTGLITRVTGTAPPGGLWWVATACAVTGCAILLADGASAGPRVVAGSLFALTAAAAYALFTVSSARAVQAGDPGAVMGLVFIASALLLAPTLTLAPAQWLLTTTGLGVAAYLGLVTTLAAYRLFGHGLRRTCAPTAALVGLAEPAFAALLGVAVLGESLGPAGVAGMALIVAAPVITTLTAGRTAART